MLGSHPPDGVRLGDPAPHHLGGPDPDHVGVDHRPVSGLHHLEGLGLVAAPDPDLLAVDGHRFPPAVVQSRRPVLVQPFEVQVLHVAPHVGHTPRVMGRVADHDSR